MSPPRSASTTDVVGLVPAAGWGRRLAPLPCSKEVYPVGWHAPTPNAGLRPKVASHHLLEAMQHAGVTTAHIIIREGKWDIPAYWGDGHRLGMHLAYLMMRLPHGTPFTLDQAYPFVRDRRVVMGFPDVRFEPLHAFSELLARQEATGADVVLGLFPAERPEKVDMVALDADGRPQDIIIKPTTTTLTDTWVCAAWTPTFSAYLHDAVTTAASTWDHDRQEMYVGHVLQAAIRDGLHVDAVRFPDGRCTDLGTPNDLLASSRRAHERVAPPEPTRSTH